MDKKEDINKIFEEAKEKILSMSPEELEKRRKKIRNKEKSDRIVEILGGIVMLLLFISGMFYGLGGTIERILK